MQTRTRVYFEASDEEVSQLHEAAKAVGLRLPDYLRSKVGLKLRKAEHGTLSMYNHHDCRCEPCMEAMRVYAREWKARRIAEGKWKPPAVRPKKPGAA